MRATSYAAAARDLLRTRALDALGDALAVRPWAEVTMAGVAQGTGVSRQTIYNEFGGREGLAQAYALREAGRLVTAVESVVIEHRDSPRDAVAAAFDLFLGLVRDHPLVREEELLALVTTQQGGPVLELATVRLAALMDETFPGATHDETVVVADITVRLAISHAAMPTGPADITAASVATVLGPYLDRFAQS